MIKKTQNRQSNKQNEFKSTSDKSNECSQKKPEISDFKEPRLRLLGHMIDSQSGRKNRYCGRRNLNTAELRSPEKKRPEDQEGLIGLN
ncbi:uncharacterized [Tachysurus ichikawai]